MKKMKLFPKIFLFTFTMMLLISIIAHLLIFLIAPSQNVLVTNMVVTNTGVSALSEVDMPRLITQTMLKTFPISIFCCAAISALFSYFFSRGITTPIFRFIFNPCGKFIISEVVCFLDGRIALPCFALVCTLLNICSVLPEKDGGYRGLRFDKCLGICFVMAFISESRDTTDA